MTEPSWGIHLSALLHDIGTKHVIVSSVAPVAADIFVFVYPVYLSALYLMGRYYSRQQYQHFALLLFFSGFGSIFVNFLIKVVFAKQRPIDDWTRDDLVLNIIPQNAFPSDHAAMSSAIAMTTLLYGLRTGNRRLVWWGGALMVMSLIMSLCRMMIGLHWPTDIIAGTLVGIIVSYVMTYHSVQQWCQRYVFSPLIKIGDYILSCIIKRPS